MISYTPTVPTSLGQFATVLPAPPGILTRREFDERTRIRIDENGPGEDVSGWYADETAPFPCPAEGCGFVAHAMTAAHLVLVWPESDDPAMLGFAVDAKKFGRDPRVVEWTPELGPALSFYRWKRIGQPVHGFLPRPDGLGGRNRFE